MDWALTKACPFRGRELVGYHCYVNCGCGLIGNCNIITVHVAVEYLVNSCGCYMINH